MNPKVDWFFAKDTTWQKEYGKLRTIVLDCGLNEELKWGCPCYTFGKTNVVLIHGFKDYCALLFFKGALLKDTEGILVQQTENVQAARQLRFTNVQEIAKSQRTITAYIHEAIGVEKAGLKVPMKKTADFSVAEEFGAQLKKSADLKKAFLALTPRRQRAYIFHFSQPKQSKTREARVAKAIPLILGGKGLEDPS